MTEMNVPLDRKTEVENIGQEIETRIVEGKSVFLPEEERLRLREMVEDRNINLAVLNEGKTLEGVHAIVAQGDKLERSLGGRANLVSFLKAVLVETVSTEKGPEVGGHVDKYFAVNEIGQSGRVDYDLKSGKLIDTRIVAVVSATHRVLMILAVESEERSVLIQGNKQTAKFLRERVLLGREKAGVVVLPDREVPRAGERLTRALPEGAIGVILKELTRK